MEKTTQELETTDSKRKPRRCRRCGKEGHDVRKCSEEVKPMTEEEKAKFLRRRLRMIKIIMRAKAQAENDKVMTFEDFESENKPE
jgi:hypothetical protein